MKIRVNLKSAGKRRQSMEPVVYQIKGCPRNVRELILAVTESGVEAYNRRMDSRDILDYLTKEQMEELLQQKQKKARGLSGIGVANVKERLRLYYGSAGRVVCER